MEAAGNCHVTAAAAAAAAAERADNEDGDVDLRGPSG